MLFVIVVMSLITTSCALDSVYLQTERTIDYEDNGTTYTVGVTLVPKEKEDPKDEISRRRLPRYP